MSLRLRLIALVAVGLVLSVAGGGVFACWNAARSVRAEMRAAITVAEQTTRYTLAQLPRAGSDARSDLERLVAAFDGDRHVEATLFLAAAAGDTAAPVRRSSVLASHAVPEWFVRLVAPGAALAMRLPVAVDGLAGTIVLTADPRNEALEIWHEFRDGLLMLLLFGGQVMVLIAWAARRTVLRPLERLAAALGRIGGGDYGARVDIGGPPELARLAEAFNGMATRLGIMEAETRRLSARLLTLQEEERAAIARDLHDEVSPFLFAVTVDLATIECAAEPNGVVAANVASIRESVVHMQRQVRALLGRLRPTGAPAADLRGAVDNLAAFWRRRCPDVALRLRWEAGATSFGEMLDGTAYRLIQEAASNAIRHGSPSAIEIGVWTAPADGRAAGALVLEVLDDGGGLADGSAVGFGLRGMAERVRALGGSLEIGNRDAGPAAGLAVIARLPLPHPRPSPLPPAADRQRDAPHAAEALVLP